MLLFLLQANIKHSIIKLENRLILQLPSRYTNAPHIFMHN